MRKHDILCVYVRETERIWLKSKERERKTSLSWGQLNTALQHKLKGTPLMPSNIYKKPVYPCLNDKVIRV